MTFTLNSVALGKAASKDNAAAAKSGNGTSEAFFLMLQEQNLKVLKFKGRNIKDLGSLCQIS